MLGFEDYSGDKPEFVGQHGCTNTPERDYIDFWQFKFYYRNIEQKTPAHLSYEQAQALVAAANNNTDGIPQQILNDLVGYGYLQKTDNIYKPQWSINTLLV